MDKSKIKIVLLGLFIVASIFFVNYFNLASFFSPEMLRESVEDYGVLGPLIFMGVYIFATVFFLPGAPITIAGGLIFGKVFGTIYVVIGATIGAVIAFFVARYLGEGFVENLLKGKHSKIHEYDEKIKENGLGVVLFLRLLPIFPFNGLNFALGLTRVKARDYIIGTFFGIIPGSFVFVYFGDSLGMLNIWNILFAVLLLALLIVIPSWIKRRFDSKKKMDVKNGKS